MLFFQKDHEAFCTHRDATRDALCVNPASTHVSPINKNTNRDATRDALCVNPASTHVSPINKNINSDATRDATRERVRDDVIKPRLRVLLIPPVTLNQSGRRILPAQYNNL